METLALKVPHVIVLGDFNATSGVSSSVHVGHLRPQEQGFLYFAEHVGLHAVKMLIGVGKLTFFGSSRQGRRRRLRDDSQCTHNRQLCISLASRVDYHAMLCHVPPVCRAQNCGER